MIYQSVLPDQLLTQGDVIDDCPVFRISAEGQPVRFPARVVVLTQACDIAQTKSELVVVGTVHRADQRAAS